MSLERAPLEHDDVADQNWFAPLAMLIAWLAHLSEQIAKLKRVRRTIRFKPNWRDLWPKLRQCEWMRDQILAAGAAQLLAGQPLDLNDFIPSTEPPADYGGPCPATPFEMNRRVLAFARWHADPEPGIRAHAERIARRAGMNIGNPRVAHGSTDARQSRAAHHEAVGLIPLMVSSTRSVRPSNHEGEQRGHAHARGPPIAHCLLPTAPPTPRRPHLRDRAAVPIPPNRTAHRPTSSGRTHTRHP